METTRRLIVLGIAGLPAAARAAPPLVAAPDRVEPFTPALQERLFGRRMPFLATFRREDYRLGFAAVTHSTDADGPTFRTIRTAFGRIRPRRVILEGFPAAWGDNPRQIVSLARDLAGQGADSYARGEAVHAAALALARRIPFAGGEMRESELVDLLAGQGFTRSDLLNVMLIKVLEQDMRGGVFSRPSGAAFEAAFARWAPMLAETHGVDAPTVEGFGAWFRTAFGTDLGADETWYRRGWPMGDGIGGRIAQAQSLARDRFLYGQIIAALNRAGRVLVVYGGSHLAGTWRALAHALGEPELSDPPSG